MSDDPLVAVPSELEIEDRIVGPVTLTMAPWLALAAAGAALLASARREPLFAVPGFAVTAAGLVGACWRPGDRPLLAWLAPLLAYRRRRAARERRTAAERRTATRAHVPATTARRSHWPCRPRLATATRRVFPRHLPAFMATVLLVALVGVLVSHAARRPPSPPSHHDVPPRVPTEPPAPDLIVVPAVPLWTWTEDHAHGLDCVC
ncbi:MAG TPA: hypothetical protein VNB24_08980 [Acidimicrobiales bacterium]|nr:hypothetical protein [Acidimicrobiales bacterium]